MYEEIRAPKNVKCRKSHGCEWCGGKIEAGTEAMHRVYKWEGELLSEHQHPDCFSAMEASADLVADYGFQPGQFERGQTYSEWAE